MNPQTTNLARVRTSIAPLVLAFCAERLRSTCQFHVAELHEFVKQSTPVAPASCDRVLRDLRAAGEVDYVILSRRQSLYRLMPKRVIQRELFSA